MRKRILHIIIIFLLVTVLLIDVVSAFGLSVYMTPSTTKTQQSSEVVIKVKISNLDVGDNGINSFTANLNYDKDVFEDLTADSVTGLNNWTASYTPDTERITLFKTTFANSDEEIFQIKLKTKSSISKSSGTASLKNIVVSNGNDEISATEVSTSIAIGTGITITPGNVATNNATNTSYNLTNKVQNTNSTSPITIGNKVNNVSNYENTNSYTTNKVNNTSTTRNEMLNNNESTTNTSVPHTGTRENVRIALVILMIVAGYIYIKFEKLNKFC